MTRRFLLPAARPVRRRSARLSIQTLESREVPAQFTPGNVVIYRVGDGTAALSSNGNAVFLDEYTPSGTLVQSVAMPTTASGNQKQLISGGTATAEGLMTRSADGNYLVMMGYARDLGGTTALSGTSPATVARVVGRVFADGTIDTSTGLTDLPAGSASPRGATTSNGTDIWISTQSSGIWYTTLGASTSTQLNNTITTMRYVNIFNGQLFTSSSTGTTRLATVGTGLPTTGGQTITNLPGFDTTGSPYGFYFVDLDAGVAGVDTVYVANDDAFGLRKYSLVSGNWTLNGSVGVDTDDYRGLTATVSGTTVTLFATRKGGTGAAGGGELITLTDSTGYNGAFSGTPTVLATSGTNKSFRGIALAPEHANTAPVNTLPATYAATEDTPKVLSGISIADDAGTLPVKVTFSVPAGTLTVDTAVTNGVTSGQVAGNGTGSVIITASQLAINTTLAAATGLTFTPATNANADVTLTMVTSDQGNFRNIGPTDALSDTDTSTITIAPVNDAPVLNDYTFTVNQDAADGTVVGTVTATDVENDTITYSITAGNTGGAFAINSATGQIIVATSAAVTGGPFTLTVTATDNGTPNESDTGAITVNVNKPPTITGPIDDRAVNEDSDPIVIDLGPVFADAEDPDSALTFTVPGNSDPSLFSSVTVLGTTLTLTLAPNANGFSALTVRATDTGGLFIEDVFGLGVTAVNDAPTLDAIGDLTVNEDAAEQTVVLTGISPGAANESSQTVSIVATSSDPAIVPEPTVQFAGGGVGTLKFTPAANANGTVTITVTLTDDGGTGNGGVNTFVRTFTVTVNPVNDAPTFDPINDVSVDEDSGEHSLNVTGISTGPADEALQNRVITATSDNPALIPNPEVDYAGGPTGVLRFTPAANGNGSAVITVTVTDNGGTANGGVNTFSRTFTITVDPVNDAPVVTDTTFAVNENAANGSVVGTVSASDIENDDLTFAITGGDPDGAFAIDPDTGVITVADHTRLGAGPFTLTVKATDDGTPNESDSGTVTVNVNHLPTTTGIGDQTVLEDAAQTTVFLGDSFADAEDADAALTYAIVSNSNASLFDSISIDSNTLNLLFTPAADANGQSTIRVRATDTGGLFVETDFTITVNAVNDAPALDPIGNLNLSEDAAEQTIDLGGILAGPANEAGQILTITATSDNPLVIPNPSVQYTSGNSTGTLKFTPVADASGTATITVTVTDNGGTANGGVNSFTQTFTVTVGQLGDRPVINMVPTPMLPPVPFRTTPTGTPVGTLLINVTDADPNALRGMAVTAVDNAKGKWQFSTDGGTNWLDIPNDVSETSALLLADNPNTRVRFLPKGLFQGFASLSFKAWDQTNGAPQGSRDNTSAGAGDDSYSTAAERAWVAVGRTLPKVDSAGHPLLAPVKEDRKASAAFPVKTFLGLLAHETGVTSTSGIAVSGADQVDGKWQFNLGRGWQDIGTVSDASALLLRPTDRVRFLPNHDFDGQATLTYHTWVPVKGLEGTRVAATGTGFSAATETAIEDVVAVNDAPVLDLSRAVTLDPVNPGQTTTAVTFGGSLAATDVDSPTIGVAITKVAGQGTWEFSRDGGTTWAPVAPVSSLKALLLTATDLVRFTAAADATAGSAALSYRAWDQFNQFPGTAGQRVPIRGTAFSKATEVLTVAVANTAPTLDTSGSPTLPPVKSSGTPGAGVLIRTLLGTAVSDADPKALKGIAITLADNANGSWQYLVGTKWIDVGSVSKDSALLLTDTTRLRFVPNAGFVGTATIEYKAWDRTAGQAGDRIDTDSGLNSFSTAVETASVTVTA